jgi:hypothetical protein
VAKSAEDLEVSHRTMHKAAHMAGEEFGVLGRVMGAAVTVHRVNRIIREELPSMAE